MIIPVRYDALILSRLAISLHNVHFSDANNYTFPALVPRISETHGGDDVAVYASGPWSHLFSGNYEQNYIPIAEAYAASIGPSSEGQTTLNQPNFSVRTDANHLLTGVCLYTLYFMFKNKFL